MLDNLGEQRGSESNQLFTRIHEVIIAPRNLVISTLFLSPRVKFLALNLIRTQVRKAYEGFSKLEKDEYP